MKQFKIYENPAGIKEAVKQGWSWPGFFFNWIWCFVKKLNGHGAGILIALFVLVILSAASAEMNILTSIVGIGVSIWLGSSGNSLREANLLKRGYDFKTTVSASNPEGAIAMYAKENQG